MLLGADDNDSIGNAYSDPMRLWAHAYTPKDLKKLFRWVEYLYYNSAQIFAGVKKFAEYPVTSINYMTDSEALRDKYRRVLEKVLGIKRATIRASIDLQVYGNSLTSVQLPFKRVLRCKSCGNARDIKYVNFKYMSRKARFMGTCEECKHKGSFEVEDRKVIDPARINIVRWDPKHINISHNPITNEYEYYLDIPGEIKDRVKKGDRHTVITMPMSVLKTIAEDTAFKFTRGEIWHMKADAPAGVESGWGYPQLVATMPLFYHAAVLRKANEAIALERIVPKRIVHPAATSSNGDPIMTMSVQSWMSDLDYNMTQWRRDPNHIMTSPVAVGQTTLGGEGRALLVDAEIQRAEDNIISAMGFPKEFVYGGLSFTGSSVTLRMLENQLESSVFQLNNFMQWICNKVSAFLGWPEIEVELGDFKMVDDVQQKQLIYNLWQGGVISKTTLAETYDIDLAEERSRIKEEQLAEMRLQEDIGRLQQEMQASLAQQAKAQAEQGQAPGPGVQYDQQAVVGEAENIAMQLMQMPESQRKSQLSSLQSEDYVMYAVVIQRMEQIELDQSNEAKMMMQQQQGGM
jgi:hypothetical protein